MDGYYCCWAYNLPSTQSGPFTGAFSGVKRIKLADLTHSALTSHFFYTLYSPCLTYNYFVPLLTINAVF